MNETQLKDFVAEYTKGIDLMNCVVYAINNDWSEPDDYSNYGCRISFLQQESCSVTDKDGVKQWYVHHHNAYVKAQLDADAQMDGQSFPPPYNFPSVDEIEVAELLDDTAKVEVETANMTYIFTVEPSSEHEHGLSIESIVGKLPFGGDPIPIL